MNTSINDYLSRKLSALSFGAVVLVVLVHSYNGDLKFSDEMIDEQSYFVQSFENFVSKGVARIAVPLFFLISGFLFFKSFEFTVKGVLSKLKGRLKNLLIPYLFWSVFGLILYLVLQSIPQSKTFFTKELIIHYSVSKLLFTIFLNPIPYQLWFVRDLIMLMIFSPVIWYLTTSSRGVWLAILIFLWTMAPKTFELFSNEALLFFTLGCTLIIHRDELLTHKFSKLTSLSLLALWLIIVSVTTYLLTSGRNTFLLSVLNNVGILIGIISVWSLYDHLNQDFVERHSTLFSCTFFIFVFHEPLLTILKKGMFFLFGKKDFSSLLIFLVAPLIAITLSMFLRGILRKSTPRLYNFTTGGR